jgi:hypothetical protein
MLHSSYLVHCNIDVWYPITHVDVGSSHAPFGEVVRQGTIFKVESYEPGDDSKKSLFRVLISQGFPFRHDWLESNNLAVKNPAVKNLAAKNPAVKYPAIKAASSDWGNISNYLPAQDRIRVYRIVHT